MENPNSAHYMLKQSAGIKKSKSATGEKMYPFTME
jgi:hypothetical protein